MGEDFKVPMIQLACMNQFVVVLTSHLQNWPKEILFSCFMIAALGVGYATFWAWKFNDFPLFLTSCKRPLDRFFSDLYVRCVHYAT